MLLFIYSIFSDEEGEEDLFNKEEGVDDEKGNLTTKGLVLVDKDEERRKAIDNEEAYLKLCQESIEILKITYQASLYKNHMLLEQR